MHHVLLDLGRFIWDNLPVRLVTICGTVTRTTDIKPELLVATWRCNDCRREISGVAQEFKVTYPPRCPTKHCGNTTNWKLLAESRSTRWGNWQRVRLQENENEVPAGSMPQTMDVIVRDEQTERCKAGDKVQITGSLIVVPDVPTLMSPSELRGNVRRSLKTRSDPSYAAGEGVRGLKSVGNRDLTYKLAFYGTYIDEVCLLWCSWLILVGYGWKELERIGVSTWKSSFDAREEQLSFFSPSYTWTSCKDSDWASRSSEEKSENIRSEEKMYLSQTDKDPEVWQLDILKSSQFWLPLDLHPEIAIQMFQRGPVWTDLRAREHERQTWLPGFVGSLCGSEHQWLPGGQEGALMSYCLRMAGMASTV